MSSRECEDMMLALMAMADGEKPLVTADLVSAHLENCATCRREAEVLSGLATLLEGQKRRQLSLDLWPTVKEQLDQKQFESSPSASPLRKWPAFIALGLLLVIYKLVEMIPERDLGLLFKLVPLVFIILIFNYVKENPFQINSGLTLEGDR